LVGGSKNRSRTAGFTLLELLVVLAIAGALLALVPPVISAVVPGTKARVAALDLASTLRDARNSAITRSNSVDVIFDTESASYSIADSDKTELPRGVALVILDRSGYVSETRHAVGHLHDPTYTRQLQWAHHPTGRGERRLRRRRRLAHGPRQHHRGEGRCGLNA
jgi:prepilin-type N-terminal cleavage/methylation domain-containing protein